MSNVHIVIPVYNQWSLCHELLWKLQKIEAKNISSIHLINDCSTDEEVVGGMKWWASSYGSKFPIRFINTEENVGFLRASNYGMQLVAGLESTKDTDIILLLSTDVNISYPFIPQIKELIEYNPESLVGGVLYSTSTGWNDFGSSGIKPYLEGWLLASTVIGWRELGYFDERYVPATFEDVDLSTTALSLGYELIPLNNPALHHLGGKSMNYTESRNELTKTNRKKYASKWGFYHD